MTRYLLAGGGTAGHVNPLLSLADAIIAANPEDKVWALGTKEGLEATLVPQRGYELLTVARLPFPRKLSGYALAFPFKFWKAVRQARHYLKAYEIDVVVGFGGYACAPAYLAAKRLGIPTVVHEANALPGWANKLGAKTAKAVGVAFKSTPLPNAQFVGMPLRREIEEIAAGADRESARLAFGLDPDTVTLLVTGGSLGAKRINETIEASRRVLSAAGIQVLHIMGGRSELGEVRDKDYVRVAYCDRMDQAIAASSFAVSRAGSSTVSEFAAVGLPAAYVPYPVGNGEQKLNVAEIIEAEGGLLVLDKDFTPDYVASTLVPLISNSRALADMASKAKRIGVEDGTARLLALVKGVL
jgi:UDP-N-acetylglucosamine--N-acetylmuramyl-(pentapeptide) pyrophosphoryl-undecaprenol N-acetylglucosamine transferase